MKYSLIIQALLFSDVSQAIMKKTPAGANAPVYMPADGETQGDSAVKSEVDPSPPGFEEAGALTPSDQTAEGENAGANAPPTPSDGEEASTAKKEPKTMADDTTNAKPEIATKGSEVEDESSTHPAGKKPTKDSVKLSGYNGADEDDIMDKVIKQYAV